MDIFIAICLLLLEPLIYLLGGFISRCIEDIYPYDDNATQYKSSLRIYCKYFVKKTPLQKKNKQNWKYSFHKLGSGLYRIAVIGFIISIPLFFI